MNDQEVKRFLRAADQRLTSADILLQNRLHLDSMYLAGYTVECALKALILSREPRRHRRDAVKRYFRGSTGHEIEALKGLLRKRGIVISTDVSAMLQKIASWSTDLRYEVGLRSAFEAQQFYDAAKGIRDWVRRSV